MPFSRLLLATLTLAAALPLSAQSPVDSLYGQRSYDLADAYYAAGQRFADLGQADRAAEFKAKAQALFPGYVPGQRPVAAAAVTPARPEPTAPADNVVREQNLQGEKVSRLQFQKLLRGYLTGNGAPVSSALADTVSVQGVATAVSAQAVADFLQAHPAEAGSPDELFLLDSLEVVDGAGQTVVVNVTANPEAPGNLGQVLPFWKERQSYTFDRVGDTWKLTAVAGR